MTAIIQKETTGCGIASIANILEKSYAEVKAKANAMGIFADDKTCTPILSMSVIY